MSGEWKPHSIDELELIGVPGIYSLVTVPKNEEWKVHSIYVVVEDGVWTFTGIYFWLASTEQLIPVSDWTHFQSAKFYQMYGARLNEGDQIKVDVDDWSAPGNCRLYAILEMRKKLVLVPLAEEDIQEPKEKPWWQWW